jgi:hypothetical protein
LEIGYDTSYGMVSTILCAHHQNHQVFDRGVLT